MVRLALALAVNAVLLALTFLLLTATAAGVLALLSFLAWFFYFLWRRQNITEKRVRKKIQGQQVILPVEHIMFWAVESSGYSQKSGMGYIAVTDSFLIFEFVLLDLSITVPVARLRGAEIVRRLKGVSPVRKMLLIRYINEEGEEDSMAIGVKDKSHWLTTINALSRENNPPEN